LLWTQWVVPFFSSSVVFWHCRLSKGELVGGFKRRSTDAADYCGAITADERIVDLSRALGAPQAHFAAFRWIRRLLIRHSEDERSMTALMEKKWVLQLAS
jgi:hypothetical protein